MAIELFEVLNKAMPPLSTLNLSKNLLTCRSCPALGEHLEVSYHLKVVKIAWNKIGGRGGIILAGALI